jgi:hypothetical protein
MLMVSEAKQPGCGKGAAVIQAMYNTSNYYIILKLAYLMLVRSLGTKKLKKIEIK